jgi:hypothetical protein
MVQLVCVWDGTAWQVCKLILRVVDVHIYRRLPCWCKNNS